MPTISVVMSVYNAEKHLAQAVESILNQTFSNFEFIIIEDFSTDNSWAILQNYAQKDQRIQLIQKPENKRMAGFIENLNIGLKKAKGKYIARMDADDISYPNRFEKQVKFLEENPDIFMVGSSINFIDENNNFIKKLDAIPNNIDIQQQMPKKIALYHPAIMFRNEPEIEYREKIFYCEDYDFYLRLISEGKKFANFEEPLLDYRILNSSISRKDGKFKRTIFVEKMKEFWRERLKNGKDSYASFVPETLLNILDTNEKSSRDDLKFGLSVATKHQYTNEFNILIKKYSRLYPFDFQIYTLKMLNILPPFFSKIFFKIFNS